MLAPKSIRAALMKRVRVTRDAGATLMRFGYALRGITWVNLLVDELTNRFALIGSSPEMGRTRGELKPGLRSHPVDNYVIYYRGASLRLYHACHPGARPQAVFSV